MKLTIIRIKPNPLGKDRTKAGATPSQLAAEWVDFRNDDGKSADLQGIALYHLAYSSGSATWDRIQTFKNTLGVGKVVRVHSGLGTDPSVIKPEDRDGADYHLFTGRNAYVWNNREGDTPLLNNDPTKETIDKASYDPNPAEGVVLVRLGDKLVGRANAASW